MSIHITKGVVLHFGVRNHEYFVDSEQAMYASLASLPSTECSYLQNFAIQ